jgi:hypothetical protein
MKVLMVGSPRFYRLLVQLEKTYPVANLVDFSNLETRQIFASEGFTHLIHKNRMIKL